MGISEDRSSDGGKPGSGYPAAAGTFGSQTPAGSETSAMHGTSNDFSSPTNIPTHTGPGKAMFGQDKRESASSATKEHSGTSGSQQPFLVRSLGVGDVILMDYSMPRVGGQVCTRCIRLDPALDGVRIIGVTGNVLLED